tara:strand:+ start:2578 stop:3213 length:636 start_codon:yes stop_codon:yes gene_type:complete
MLHKSILFYRQYLKTKTENSTILLPLDLIPPDHLKENRPDKNLNLDEKEAFRRNRNKKRRELTDYIFSKRHIQVQSFSDENYEYLYLYSKQSTGIYSYLGSTLPLFISDDVSFHLWAYRERSFIYVDTATNVTMYEIPYSVSKHINNAYYLNAPKEKPVKTDDSLWDRVNRLKFNINKPPPKIDETLNTDNLSINHIYSSGINSDLGGGDV